MVNTWTPEAERLTPRGTPGTMSGIGGARATLHCTVSTPGSFAAMNKVLTDKAAEPHYLYDPKTDRLGQYFPLDKSARALLGSPAVSPSHNKAGKFNVQVEICAMPTDWTAGWTPGPKFRAMMRDIAALGVAPKFVFDLPRNGSATERDRVARPASVIYGAAGGGLWWGHCHYKRPEIHWDPGPINEARFFSGYPNQEDDMPSAKEIADEILSRPVNDAAGAEKTVGWAIGAILRDGQRQNAALAAVQAADPAAIAAAVVKALPATVGDVDENALAKAIVVELVAETTKGGAQ